MKAKALFIILFVTSFSLSAQIRKGTFMAEGGINLTGNWDYDSNPFTEGFGISFGTSDYYTKDYITGGASYSIIPKLKINLLAKVRHMEERPINTSNFSTSHTKTLDSDFALVLSFSYFLNRRIKE
jgi:hypothetical protein